MSKSKAKLKDSHVYPHVRALAHQIRLMEESLVTPESFPNPQGKQLKTHTRTTSTFEIGLPDNERPPKSFQVTLQYSVKLTADKPGSDPYATYSSKTTAVFQIVNPEELGDLQGAPIEYWGTYFSFVHLLARRTALERIVSAGFQGIKLPVPDNVKTTLGDDVPLAEVS